MLNSPIRTHKRQIQQFVTILLAYLLLLFITPSQQTPERAVATVKNHGSRAQTPLPPFHVGDRPQEGQGRSGGLEHEVSAATASPIAEIDLCAKKKSEFEFLMPAGASSTRARNTPQIQEPRGRPARLHARLHLAQP